MDSKFVQLKGLSFTDVIKKINSELTEDICTEQLQNLEVVLKERILKRDKQKIINSDLLSEINILKLKTENLSNQYEQSQEKVRRQEEVRQSRREALQDQSRLLSNNSRVLYECARPLGKSISTQNSVRPFSCNPINTPIDEEPDGRILTHNGEPDGNTIGGTFLNKEQCTQQCFLGPHEESNERNSADLLEAEDRTDEQRQIIRKIEEENREIKAEFKKVKKQQEIDRKNGIIKTKEERNTSRRTPSMVPQQERPQTRSQTQPRRQSTQDAPDPQNREHPGTHFKRPQPQRRQSRTHVPNRGNEQTQQSRDDTMRDRISRDDALRTQQRQRRQNSQNLF